MSWQHFLFAEMMGLKKHLLLAGSIEVPPDTALYEPILLQIYVRQRHNIWLEDFWLTGYGPQTRVVYSSDKERRIVYLVEESLSKGQPVLIGCTSVEESEQLHLLMRAK